MANHENAYSTSCEIVGPVKGSINAVALHDFSVMKELFNYDFTSMKETLISECFSVLEDYKNVNESGKIFNKRIRDRICDLSQSLDMAETTEEFKDCLTQFYREFGVGKLGLHKAFRVEHPEGGTVKIVPITNIAHVYLDDLVGYDAAKKKLIDNTRAFVEGKKANNCLLFGDAGTRTLAASWRKPGPWRWRIPPATVSLAIRAMWNTGRVSMWATVITTRRAEKWLIPSVTA